MTVNRLTGKNKGPTNNKPDSSVRMADRIQFKPTKDLVPYDRNARTHTDSQVDKIAASILEFGFTNPILVDKKRGVIAGHGRLLAAQKLGITSVPVVELAHLTDAQKRAYIIADNKLALDAGWDDDLLAAELGALRDDGFNLSVIGFSQEELAVLEDGWKADWGQVSRVEAGGTTPIAVIRVRCPFVLADQIRASVIKLLLEDMGLKNVAVE